MNSSDIPTDAADKLMSQVRVHLDWTRRVRQRMKRLGFPPHDPLYVACARAYDALQEFHVRAHYASCKSGVAKSK